MESVKVFTTRKRCCGQVIVKGLTICSLLARLESAYSLIWGSLKIWGKGGRDTLALL